VSVLFQGAACRVFCGSGLTHDPLIRGSIFSQCQPTPQPPICSDAKLNFPQPGDPGYVAAPEAAAAAPAAGIGGQAGVETQEAAAAAGPQPSAAGEQSVPGSHPNVPPSTWPVMCVQECMAACMHGIARLLGRAHQPPHDLPTTRRQTTTTTSHLSARDCVRP